MRDCRHLVSLIPLELYHSRSGGSLVATLLNLPLPSKDVERMVEATNGSQFRSPRGKDRIVAARKGHRAVPSASVGNWIVGGQMVAKKIVTILVRLRKNRDL